MDQGGPRREFFRLLALGAADRYFIGKDTMKFMDTNVTALQVHVITNFMMCTVLGFWRLKFQFHRFIINFRTMNSITWASTQ